ncbi:MAG: class 1 fructose-bisphosphatase [Prosthecochloris sp.]|uniref:Fructose-1,6-bisphosphatase class 1 n=1 Tax=Prosthecochloris aestuarii (strain DSM 271 / SK 413) TaxID=290512 RepID=F16PA_PROA2|nr:MULTISPECIES: class 1 fructose-bisphosphatase [Prosthecochloris]B4S3F3.1 RecName: Full=Fructose-1,6-bisphosphatase class 1; Short=FBPase class 1; AltName: Full=D-fructose-1,6-bisphosphate 1-phosphohydrolase class 1 [Prosthecochloris aestuarii DSM 271]ACF46692.1 Inositol phosphatase/fructose-16-bisphosphatase [Prosthecochloris aestuarii DSM 271]MCW8797398.1 class 1 fructose-bisphosphatase [Prosthecochloris sp.]NEX11974.1 fructose 1,6-bisphosphatase [Prosthecochloris sp.]RDD29768.1 fructose 1
MNKLITIERHFLEQQKSHPEATGELTDLLNDVAFAAKLVRREVVRAGLADILGMAGTTNVQGEEVKKLDLFANEKIINAIGEHGRFALMGSEENEGTIIPPNNDTGRYILLFDPLDGSSNIDVNVSVGTIFSIYRLTGDDPKEADINDCLQKGSEQVAAGYVIYGSSVMMVYTTGQGVHGFTYDPTIGEFLLSHENITTPERGKYYSINEGSLHQFNDSTVNFINYLKEDDEATGRPYSTRYIGSLVADFHRNLMTGGVFVYPATKGHPNGKLRLMYEANPLAFICEQAGGRATNGKERILDINPTELHQRTPLYIGSKEDVLKAEEFEKEG